MIKKEKMKVCLLCVFLLFCCTEGRRLFSRRRLYSYGDFTTNIDFGTSLSKSYKFDWGGAKNLYSSIGKSPGTNFWNTKTNFLGKKFSGLGLSKSYKFDWGGVLGELPPVLSGSLASRRRVLSTESESEAPALCPER